MRLGLFILRVEVSFCQILGLMTQKLGLIGIEVMLNRMSQARFSLVSLFQ